MAALKEETNMQNHLTVLLCTSFYLSAGQVHAAPISPSSYLCFDSSAITGCGSADSPLKGINFSNGYFYLEDFEDNALNTPGVTGSGSFTGLDFIPSQRDSVDEDDGVIDGASGGAGSYHDGDINSGPKTISFTFNETILGALPTHVGFVWTDGLGNTTFEAFGPGGSSLGTIGPVNVSDALITGETAEDTFFGWIDIGGISTISISDDLTGVEVDHLQYGSVVPIPPALSLFGTGLLGLIGIARMKVA